MRPLCQSCHKNAAAINCYRGDKIYYRSRCLACIRKKKKLRPQEPRWRLSGYKKKATCDRCGFRARLASQLLVYHVDGNLNNAELRNLKTVCLNCVEEINKQDLTWQAGDLEPDR